MHQWESGLAKCSGHHAPLFPTLMLCNHSLPDLPRLPWGYPTFFQSPPPLSVPSAHLLSTMTWGPCLTPHPYPTSISKQTQKPALLCHLKARAELLHPGLSLHPG